LRGACAVFGSGACASARSAQHSMPKQTAMSIAGAWDRSGTLHP
jgi:hypothetical protein